MVRKFVGAQHFSVFVRDDILQSVSKAIVKVDTAGALATAEI